MSGLLYLDLRSRKVCMGFSTSHCCDNPVVELKRFEVIVIRDGDSSDTCLAAYDMFEVNDDQQMCVLLDDAMSKLCNGRYVFKVTFDKCMTVARVPFMWGGKPVLTSVDVEEGGSAASTLDGCVGEFEAGLETGGKMPITCCDPCDDGSDCGECDVCVPLKEHYPNGEYSPDIKPDKCCE